MVNSNEIKIFSGNSNSPLANEISKILGIPLGKCKIGKFSNGETSVDINESVRGKDIFLIQSTNEPVNDNLMELLIMIDAFKRASARRITAVVPYYGYARQDRKAKARDPITSKLVADILTSSGADRVLTMDLHATQIQGYFDIPVDHLLGIPILADYFVKKGFNERNDIVVVSPDFGSITRARKFSEFLNAPIAIIEKKRPKASESEIMSIIGEVDNKIAILIDDVIDTAGTIVNGANALKDLGVKEIYCCCTHPGLSGNAVSKLDNSPIKEVVMLNTINILHSKIINKFKILSVAPIFAEAIRRIHEDIPLSKLFE